MCEWRAAGVGEAGDDVDRWERRVELAVLGVDVNRWERRVELAVLGVDEM